MVDFSYKSDGFIPTNELSDSIQPQLEEGLEIDELHRSLKQRGVLSLSESKARAEPIWDELFDIMNRKEVVEVQLKRLQIKAIRLF